MKGLKIDKRIVDMAARIDRLVRFATTDIEDSALRAAFIVKAMELRKMICPEGER